MAAKRDSEIKQVGRFGLVGILNFAVDFVIFNSILHYHPSAKVLASVIAGTVAMINSYIFNQRFTFKTKHVGRDKTIVFFGLTAFGVWVIRPIVVYIFSSLWTWPAKTAFNIQNAMHLPFHQDFVTNNLALVAAIAVVLVYNYITYKKYVFTS